MAYEFAENEDALEPQASSSRSGEPPRKWTGIGILDPPFPPKRPPGPIPSVPSSKLYRIVAGMILVAIIVTLFLLLLARHSTG